MVDRVVGTIAGKGTLQWKGAEPISISYEINGLYNPARHNLRADGVITHSERATPDAFLVSDAVLTTEDGRKLDVVLLSDDAHGRTKFGVNSAIREFQENSPRQR